jgi:hypothetical protein
VRWTKTQSCYTFPAVVCDGCSLDEIRSVTKGLMDTSAFHNNVESRGFRGTLEQSKLLRTLEKHDYVCQREEGSDASWFFTELGISVVTRCSIVSEPRPVYEVRNDLPLENLSSYELAVKLEQGGWKWQLWIPPSGRRRHSGEK